MKTAIYPGSFDPITKGHLDVLKRAADIFDKVILVVSVNVNKKSFLSLEDKLKLIKESCKDIPNVESIIYAGSVSSNDYILSMIKEALPETLNHYRSAYASTAVVKGAVIFGFNPFNIKYRISKYTIGISVREKWNKSRHWARKDLKVFDKKDKCYYCINCFSPIIFQNQKIEIEESLSHYYELMDKSSELTFYKTNCDKVKFIDEKYLDSNSNEQRKCIELCKTYLDVGMHYDSNERQILVELKLGGTYVYGKLIYKNYEFPVHFDFSKEE